MPRPKSDRTIRSIRMDDVQWFHIRELSHRRYQSISEVVRAALAEYISRNPLDEEDPGVIRMMSNTEWYAEHCVPLHNGGRPLECEVCNEQFRIREKLGKW